MEPPIIKWFAVPDSMWDTPRSEKFARDVAAQFDKLAHALVDALADGPERATALRKLLESRDAAVRAAIETSRVVS